MKTLWMPAFLCLLLVACNRESKQYELIVRGQNLDKLDIVLVLNAKHTERGSEIMPVKAEAGRLTFTGSVNVPCFANLKIGDQFSKQFVVSNQKILVELDPETLEISSIKAGYQQQIKEKYDQDMNPIMQEMRLQYNQMSALDQESTEYAELRSRQENLSKQAQTIQITIIEEHPDAIVAPYALWSIYGRMEESEAIRLLNLIDPSLSEQAQYAFIEPTIRAWERSPLGSMLPDMSQSTPEGETISLSDYRGKYLLIDFWASWCAPCRAVNPEMLELYNKYHAHGLEMLGVSLDRNAEDWKLAIEQDSLIWDHVSDLMYWDNEISRYFGINSIPYTILVDPDGRIIAKKLHVQELENKLKDILL
jgi:thiol-disulfide isomerase/thioredoxin